MEQFIGIIGILAAIALFRSYGRVKKKLRAAQRWPTTRGRVIDATYRVRKHSPRYSLKMQFEYTVGDRTYEGNQHDISLASSRCLFRDEQLVNEAINYWKSRNPLTVYYNPLEPADCLLELQDPSKATGILLGAFAMLAIGGAILVTNNWDMLEPHVMALIATTTAGS